LEARALGRKYISVSAIKELLRSSLGEVKDTTVNQYLSSMKKNGKIFSAGRGWYSSISDAFQLDTQIIEKPASFVSTKFPLLQFTAWSTGQLQAYSHHMMTRFCLFIFTHSEAIGPLSNTLKDNGYTTYANPQMRDVEKFVDLTQPNVVVVRGSVSREPHQGHFASAEKILVDLFLEKDRLSLMDTGEYCRILRNILTSSRINISGMLQYAERRKVDTALVRLLRNNFAEDIMFPNSGL
jgi:hypothetical protein